jgi:hypothetical protein
MKNAQRTLTDTLCSLTDAQCLLNDALCSLNECRSVFPE